MPADPAVPRLALAEEIATADPTLNPAWRDAVAAVPRELFLGDAAFKPTGAGWEPVHRTTADEDEWLRMVCSDQTWVTQVEGKDASDATGPVAGSPTSSAALPSPVVRTAQVAGLRPGQKVLEVGTGTGYSTALLSRRLGPGTSSALSTTPASRPAPPCICAMPDTRRRS